MNVGLVANVASATVSISTLAAYNINSVKTNTDINS